MSDLDPYGDRLFSVARGKAFSDLDPRTRALLTSHPEKIKRPKMSGRYHDTENARVASTVVRARKASDIAGQISAIRDALVAQGVKTTPAKIAEAANAKGLVTARGQEWKAQNVGRVLSKSDATKLR